MQFDCFPDARSAWPRALVGKLAEINPRYPVKKGQDYPFVEMASVSENFGGIRRFDLRKLEGSGLTRFKAKDTLFAKITPCPENGKVAYVGSLSADVGLGSTEFIVLSPKDGTQPRFLYHLVCAHPVRGRAAARMEGSTGRQRVPEDVFARRLLVPMPEPDEQSAIACVLDTVDQAIERARTAIAAALELRASLIFDLLSKGVGADGRVRSSDVKEFDRTLMGLLPRTWRPSDIRTEFEIQNGITLNEAQRARRPKWRYLRVANVQRDALSLDDIQVLEANEAEVAPRLLAENDLLIVEGHADRMQIGRCALATATTVGMTFQNHLFRLRSRGGVLPEFACLWLNSWHAQRYWNAMCATSSGLNTINQKMLKRMSIPVPPPDEQEQIAGIIKASKANIAALEGRVAALTDVKKSLLHDLLAGTVPLNPSKVLEAATP